MASANTRLVILTAFCMALLQVHQSEAAAWIRGGASYYGGMNGSAADAGACGYKNVTTTPGYGLNTASVSWFLWDNAGICGACYEVKCDANIDKYYCRKNKSVIVTVTNFCPESAPGNFCIFANASVSLTKKMYTDIISIPLSEGVYIAPILIRRVNCTKPGFVKFRIAEGTSPYFLMITISNVAGAGSLQAVQISFDGGKNWTSMYRNWGSNWSLSDGKQYDGKPFSFRLTAKTTNEIVTALNVVQATWAAKTEYTSKVNFKKAPP